MLIKMQATNFVLMANRQVADGCYSPRYAGLPEPAKLSRPYGNAPFRKKRLGGFAPPRSQ